MNAQTDRVTITLFYAGAFALYYLVSFLVSLFPDVTTLRSSGLLVPVLCLFEFAVLFPLYRFYQSRRDDIPQGTLRLNTTLLFIGGLLLLMVLQAGFLQPESWLEEQSHQPFSAVAIMVFSAVLLAPVFEEILFRGFLLQGFLLWAPKSRFACMVLTSVLFAAMHTQYIHWQTMVVLMLFSLLLCFARLKTNSLLLPIVLHMLNNLVAMLPALWYGISA